MRRWTPTLVIVILLTGACSPVPTEPTVRKEPPSYNVAAFYYPWYGNPATDGQWIHWHERTFKPPLDISSDYYPQLGPYSSNDATAVAQHMAWLRGAGVGVIITSWWGRGTNEDRAVPQLLRIAHRYDIKVAFHLEPYTERTGANVLDDIKYLYQQYGNSPAFFRSTAVSRYSPGQAAKGMFFVFCIESAGACGQNPVTAPYWRSTMDAVHALPEGALVIANIPNPSWIRDGHFDGLYNFVTPDLERDGGFSWARSLPPGSLYVPTVIPGFSAKRIGYAADTYVPRLDGTTYGDQWAAAHATFVKPELVTINSFNEWHEGTMIEPVQVGVNNGLGYTYADFGQLAPDGYIARTEQWVTRSSAIPWPATYRARIRISTTSDWTNVDIASGATLIRPERISVSSEDTEAYLENFTRFVLTQPLNEATAGRSVEMVYDVVFTWLDPASNVVLTIERGNLGATHVTVYNYVTDVPREVAKVTWDGITSGQNSFTTQVASSALM